MCSHIPDFQISKLGALFFFQLPAQKEWNGIHVVVHVLAHVLTMTKFLVVHESVCVVVSVLKGLFLMMKRSVYQSQIALVISVSWECGN